MSIIGSIKPNILIFIKLFITYELLMNSVKFFTYLYDETCFNIASFAIYNPNVSGLKLDNIVLTYSKFKYDLTFVFISFIIFFLIGVLIYFYLTRKSFVNYICFILFYALILKTDLVRLYIPSKFYSIVPLSSSSSLNSFLFLNGIIFVLLAVLIIFFPLSIIIKNSHPPNT